MRQTFAIAATVALVAATAAPAFAEGTKHTTHKTTETHINSNAAPAAGFLSQAQASQKITAAGYTGITGLSLDKSDNVWDAKAMKGGQQYDLEVNASTGAIVKSELED